VSSSQAICSEVDMKYRKLRYTLLLMMPVHTDSGFSLNPVRCYRCDDRILRYDGQFTALSEYTAADMRRFQNEFKVCLQQP
jgi:hypothetical protein